MFKNEAKFQLAFFIGPAILGGFMAVFLPRFGVAGSASFLIGAIGFGFLLFAKLSEKKRTKKMVNWGVGDMILKEKISYFLGYSMIISYFVFSIILKLLYA